MTATSKELPKFPAKDALVASVFEGSGGMCLHLSVAFTEILQEIGYKAHLIGGSIRGQVDKHVMTFVETEEGNFVVDIGSGGPIHEPIPLNELPFEFESAGFEIEYRQIPGTSEKFERVYRHGDFKNGAYPVI